MNAEIQRIIINMQPIFTSIYELLVKFWKFVQVIIGIIVQYKPLICKFTLKTINIILFVYNFMWKFTEALHSNDFVNTPPDSPKKPLIDKSWCDIDPNNIINNDKNEIIETRDTSSEEPKEEKSKTD
jgi:hypothetical protein